MAEAGSESVSLDTQKQDEAVHPPWGVLLAAYGLSRWGERTWEFVAGLLLLAISAKLQPGEASLVLVAGYGLLLSVFRFLFGSLVGSALDRMPLGRGPLTFLSLQNLLVAVSAASLAAAMTLPVTRLVLDGLVYAAIAAAIGGGVCSIGMSVGVEAKWVKAFYGSNEAVMVLVNSRLRTFDLACQMLAPFTAGLIMTVTGPAVAAAAIAAWHAVVWVPIAAMLRAVYSVHEGKLQSALDGAGQLRPELAEESAPTSDAAAAPEAEAPSSRRSTLWMTVDGFAVFFRQPIWPLLFALAMLYFTVLSLGLLMTTYLKWTGMTEFELSVYRGVGGLTGMAAAAGFPLVRERLGLRRGALAGILFQFLCLAGGVAADMLLTGTGVRTRLLVAGLMLSRAGLWTFDLCVLQMMQVEVSEEELGRVGSVQSSLQSFFDAAMYCVALFCHSFYAFHILMVISVCTVGLAMLVTVRDYVLFQGKASAAGYAELSSVAETAA